MVNLSDLVQDRTLEATSAEGSSSEYAEAILLYALVGVILAALFGAGVLLWTVVARCYLPLCCIFRGGFCGKRYPTIRTCCWGFTLEPGGRQFRYAMWSRWLVRISMVAYAVAMFTLVGIAHEWGNKGITASMHTARMSPAWLVGKVKAAEFPLLYALSNFTGGPASTVFSTINSTVEEGADLNVMIQGADTVVAETEAGLPDARVLQDIVEDIAGAISRSNSSGDAVELRANVFESTLTAVVPRLIEFRRAVSDLRSAKNRFDSLVDRAIQYLDELELQSSVAHFDNRIDGIRALRSELQAVNTTLPLNEETDYVR